jgi:hypothetical protein
MNKEENEIVEMEEFDCDDCPPKESKIKQIIRPGLLIITMFYFLFLTMYDGNFGSNFHVRDAYLPILETVLVTMVIAYFSSRGIEKTAENLYGRNRDKYNQRINYKYRPKTRIKKSRDPNFPGYDGEE